MDIETFADPTKVAQRAAARIAADARAAIASRGRFLLAVSGGHTPWSMLRALATLPVDWARVHLFQVDERVAPDGDPSRNLTRIQASLLGHVPIPEANVHPMPVSTSDAVAAAADYARTLRTIAGDPGVLDLVHLGLGLDGHTASLVPGDPILDVTDADVGVAGPYQGQRRMTLTYPALDRARAVLFVATGAEKAAMVHRLQAGDTTIPAGRVDARRATLLVDTAAASATT
jgi:6-phosphogluconolactonase